MGKNYHCDYCDKKLKGGIGVRKKHIEGLLHQKARIEHYAQFKDLKTFIEEEKVKTTCSRILKNQECSFGAICRFSHYHPQQLLQLEQEVHAKDFKKWLDSQPNFRDVDVDEFLKKRNDKISKEKIEFKPFWTYTHVSLSQEELPPSLRELDPSRLTHEYEDWG